MFVYGSWNLSIYVLFFLQNGVNIVNIFTMCELLLILIFVFYVYGQWERCKVLLKDFTSNNIPNKNTKTHLLYVFF